MGEILSHYEVLEKLAEGGMGVVYKARDVRLDRLVALKFISKDLLASDEDIERFLHEARAISRLNHPNIATIYDVDEVDGRRFLALEYLPGGTLGQKVRAAMRNGGPFSLDQILGFAGDIARALNHAHRHGIVHRDVKSENAMLTEEGAVKLTDFGVALVAGKKSFDDETAGTAAYMSPEQAQGLAVDHRSDIFSFGIVLYELTTGRVPFLDSHEAAILYDIVHSAPPPVHQFRDDLPIPFDEVLSKLLAKDPDDRYQSMEFVLEDLRLLRGIIDAQSSHSHKPVAVDPSVAVLPFVDMSPQRDQEYFCDGITEEIINALTTVKELKVVSRTSSFQFKNKAYDIREIGRLLQVQTVVEGSVRKAGDRLRITVQHINVADGYHLWSERYDRDMNDVFAIQDEIAHAVVKNLRSQFTEKHKRSLVKKPTESMEAYNIYLEGRFRLNQRTGPTLKGSLKSFEKALEIDEHFALAYAGMAEASVLLAIGSYADNDPATMMKRAREAAHRAIELDDQLAEAHVALALVSYRADWNFSAAEKEFRVALELNEGYASGHHHYGMYLAAMNRVDEALVEIRRAQELDPLSLIINTALGRALYWARRYDDAIDQGRRAIELDPSFVNAHFDLSVAYAACGKHKEAIEAAKTAGKLIQDEIRTDLYLAVLYGKLGRRKEAKECYDRVIEHSTNSIERSANSPVPPFVMAIMHIGFGDIDRAVEFLEQACEKRDAALVYLQCEPALDEIREHPRYPALLSRIGFPENN